MAIKTFQTSFSPSGPSAIIVPVACRRVTLRELITDAAPVSYWFLAPSAADQPYPKLQSEAVEINAGDGSLFRPGDIAGYIQTIGATATFSVQCDG